MTILQKLINAMLQRIEAVPVPQQELDDFLRKTKYGSAPSITGLYWITATALF